MTFVACLSLRWTLPAPLGNIANKIKYYTSLSVVCTIYSMYTCDWISKTGVVEYQLLNHILTTEVAIYQNEKLALVMVYVCIRT